MIHTFLDIERLTDGQMELRRDQISVPELIRTCMQRAQPLAERKNIRMEVSTLDTLAIIGDRELMEYAIYNLLTNAIKYSPSDTLVTVDAARSRDLLRISVRDQGIGMDEKELGSIFQKFYRTRKAEASGEAGTGIGLSIVDQIVAHHRGRIEVTSTPGQGSCFTMVLPGGIGPSPLHAS
jgi:signal transduction histidine kinase